MPLRHCASCGQSVDTPWCAQCGQRQPADDDFSLRRLLAEAREELTNTDSRLWRTLVGIFRPGLLTRAYLDYQWQRYLPPLRLFLLASAVYFFLAWDPYYQANAAAVLAAPDTAVPPALKAAFADPMISDRMSNMTSLLKFLFVVPMGLWMALLMRGNRRPIGAHMVFSMHYTTADFALFSLGAPLVALAPPGAVSSVFGLVMLVVIVLLLVWAILGVRRVYERGWVSSMLRGAAIVGMDIVLSLLASQLATTSVLLWSR